MTRFLLSVYDFFSARRMALFAILTLLILTFLLLAYHIHFKEDISQFLPSDSRNERINDAYKYVSASNTVAVYCTADSTAGDADEKLLRQIEAIDRLSELLQLNFDSTSIKTLRSSVNPGEMLEISAFVTENMPYFLEKEDYQRFDSLLSRDAIARQLETDRDILTSSAGMIVRENILSDPLRLSNPLINRLQDFKIGDSLFIYQDHIFSADSMALLFIDCTVSASETAKNKVLTDSLQSFVRTIEAELKNVKIESFGASEIAVTNARQIKKDTLWTSLIAVLAMLALLYYSFRNIRRILLVFAAVIFGGLFALALLFLIRGEVSIIAVGISSIMFGIAINYPL
ncbi:MAG: MMPL family transporter, partial [Tannerella sp.]|nr:MMPL family transporter [Tannerella sp.]